MLFFAMNIQFLFMKMLCAMLISLLFYYFQFHFLHKCSRMGHKYEVCFRIRLHVVFGVYFLLERGRYDEFVHSPGPGDDGT